MKQPVPIPVSVALSDKEYCYPSWMRSQSIASPPPLPLTCALQHFTDRLPAPIYTPKGGGGGKWVTHFASQVFFQRTQQNDMAETRTHSFRSRACPTSYQPNAPSPVSLVTPGSSTKNTIL